MEAIYLDPHQCRNQSGHKFILWKSSKLKPGTWLEVTGAIRTESGGQLTLTDPNATAKRAFYVVSRDTRL